MAPRCAGTTASAAPPSRSDQDAAAPGSGGAGPGLGPEGPTPTCARIFRMTAGSCRVAIRRSRPPQWGHARTSMANARQPEVSVACAPAPEDVATGPECASRRY